MFKFIFYFSLPFTLIPIARGQHVLQRKISVAYKNETTEIILRDLQKQLNISFSYPSNLFSLQKKFTFQTVNEETRAVLYRVFDPSKIEIEERAHYIILKRRYHPVKVHHLKAASADSIKSTVVTHVPESISISNDSLDGVIQGSQNAEYPELKEDTPSIHLPKTSEITSSEKPTYKFHTRHFFLIHYAKGNYQHSQIALLLNKGKKVVGSQIGLINIAQSVSGSQIGLINICKKGYHKFELWTSSSLQGNIGFKTGTRNLYTIIAAGLSSDKDFEDYDWGLGYGIGKEFNLGQRACFTIDAVLYQLGSDLKSVPSQLNLVQQFRLNTGYKVSESISLFVGPEINIRITGSSAFSNDNDNDSDDHRLHNTFNNFDSKSLPIWLGFNGGIRF